MQIKRLHLVHDSKPKCGRPRFALTLERKKVSELPTFPGIKNNVLIPIFTAWMYHDLGADL